MAATARGDASALTALFQHNTWANLILLAFCEDLSTGQLDAVAVGGFGSIRDTLVHIVNTEPDYVNLAMDTLPPVPPPDHFVGFAVLRDTVRWSGEELLQLALSARADTIVRVERPGEPIFEYPLTGLLVQALSHSAGHREQISTIITQLGLEPPSTSGWAFMRERGEFREFDAPTGVAE